MIAMEALDSLLVSCHTQSLFKVCDDRDGSSGLSTSLLSRPVSVSGL